MIEDTRKPYIPPAIMELDDWLAHDTNRASKVITALLEDYNTGKIRASHLAGFYAQLRSKLPAGTVLVLRADGSAAMEIAD